MTMSPLPVFSRRRFLALSASLGIGGFVAACGGKSSSTISGVDGSLQIVKRFPNSGLVAGDVRLPISLADKSGVLSASSSVALPKTLTGKIVTADSDARDIVLSSITAEQHGKNLSVPYWPFVFPIDKVGIYALVLDVAPDVELTFQIEERKDVSTPLNGDALPPFDTPTLDDNRGVDPICTKPEGTCPFHSVTLTDALKSGKPVVYLIGTPAYCQTGTCAPGLDALIDVAQSVGDSAVFVHADVYKDKTATIPAPAVTAYKLDYEPVLYITDANGVLVNRLDAVFDEVEIRSVLAAAGIS
jgi:hypothetical protein